MQPVSANWAAGLTDASVRPYISVDVQFNGVVIYSGLTANKGKVVVDKNADIRRYCIVELVDPTGTITPAQFGGLLTPIGNEIVIYRGLAYADGSIETMPLGVFRISTSKIKETYNGGVVIEIHAYDRSKYVNRQDFPDAYVIAGGTNASTAIRNIVAPRVPPNCGFNFPPTGATTPTMIHGIGDTHLPWKVCQELADLNGTQLFFDVQGNCVQIYEPNASTLPVVWSAVESPDGFTPGTLLSVEHDWTDEHVYNDIVVHSEGTRALHPLRSEAKDTNAGSLMNVSGAFGAFVRHMRTPLASDQASADAISAAELKKSEGKLEDLTIKTVVNPALDINDVIYVKRSTYGLDGNYIIDALEVPLDLTSNMSFTIRKAQ